MRRIAALACALACLALPAAANAAITTTRDAQALANSMTTAGAQSALGTAAFTEIPPNGAPHGVSTSLLGGFPDDGADYAILTNGDVQLADDANSGGSSGANDGGPQGHDDPNVVGDVGNAFDSSILRIDFTTPPGTNCLSFGFRFYSEEFPENVGESVNDGFIAQLDTSTWWTESGTGLITAPGNFAFDDQDAVISVNTSGASATEAVGTTYDGATPKLSAARELTPGPHSLYLSIFDQGDGIYDSAVFVDRLNFLVTEPGGCVRGAQQDTVPPAVTIGASQSSPNTATLSGAAGNAPGDLSQVTARVYAGGAVAGTPVQTLTATRAGAAWSVGTAPLPVGTYTAVAEQNDVAGNTGTGGPVTFAIAPQQEVEGETEQSPVPVLGETVVVGKVGKGSVRIRLKNGKFRKLGAKEAIPLGSEIDATKGRVRLAAAASSGGAVQTADFSQGAFVVTQTGGRRKPVTQLALSAKLNCGKSSKKARTSAKKKKVRRLWGDGKGNFRTRGRNAAATVRGTKWLTEDRCDSTKISVRRGQVQVRDLIKRKNVLVKQGRSYVAKKRK